MKYGLKENIIKKIQIAFSAFPEVDEAVLYGSRAKGNFKPGSDIDLTWKGDHLNLSVMNKISMLLDDLLLPYTLDLSIYHQIDNTELIDHIERVGISFYKAQGSNILSI
jgi:predicted nucleotidyltransferase